MNDDGMRSWRLAALTALGVIVLSVPFYVVRDMQREATRIPLRTSAARFVGREQCID